MEKRQFEVNSIREQLGAYQSPVSEDSIRQLIRREIATASNQLSPLDYSKTAQQAQSQTQSGFNPTKKVQFTTAPAGQEPWVQQRKTSPTARRFFPVQEMNASDRHREEDEENANQYDNRFSAADGRQGNVPKRFTGQQATIQISNNNIKNQNNLTQVNKQLRPSLWDETLVLFNQGNINGAYSLLLDEEDDVYLLRLMMLSGPCLKMLKTLTSRRLLTRICLIINSHFLDKMYIGVFQQCLEENLMGHLAPIDRKKIANQVYQLSSSADAELGESAAELYLRLARESKE